MKRIPLVAAILALVLILAACSETVYTPGSPSGNTTTKTIVVRFKDLQVIHDCDSFGSGPGEFYYTMTVDGTVVGSVGAANPTELNDGMDWSLSGSKTLTVSKGANDTFTVGANVYEKDPLGSTTVGTFSHTYTEVDNWGITSDPSTDWTVDFNKASTCEVKVWWHISGS